MVEGPSLDRLGAPRSLVTDSCYHAAASERLATAQRIAAQPWRYKVCTQCLSISFLKAGVCPVCHAYRFDYAPRRVIDIALLLPANVFPLSSGTVPRI